jgi:hypothetical protein
VVQDPSGEGKIVYLFLPIYKARISRVSFGFLPRLSDLKCSAETFKM